MPPMEVMIASNPKIKIAHLIRLCKITTEFIIFILSKFRQIVGQFMMWGLGIWNYGLGIGELEKINNKKQKIRNNE